VMRPGGQPWLLQGRGRARRSTPKTGSPLRAHLLMGIWGLI
jgi:hypothetical protein